MSRRDGHDERDGKQAAESYCVTVFHGNSPFRWSGLSESIRVLPTTPTTSLERLVDDYLTNCRARGLSEKASQALLIQAFVGEAIESIADDGLRDLAIAAASRWLEARG